MQLRSITEKKTVTFAINAKDTIDSAKHEPKTSTSSEASEQKEVYHELKLNLAIGFSPILAYLRDK